jgi:CheY-like chemotaxis protein
MENRFLQTKKIFSSRLLLTLDNLNKKTIKLTDENKIRNYFNIFLSILCLIFQAINIIITNHYEIKLMFLGFMLYISTSVSLAFMILSILHFCSLVRIKYSDFCLTSLMFGANYICLEINILFVLTYYNILEVNYQIFIFICSIIFSLKLGYFTLLIRYSLFTIIFLLLTMTLELIIISQSAYCTTLNYISFILNNIICFMISYSIGLHNNLNFFLFNNINDFLRNEMSELCFYESFLDSMTFPLLKININSEKVFANKSMRKLLNIKNHKSEEKKEIELSENIQRILEYNKFNLFFSNEFHQGVKEHHKIELGEKMKIIFDSLILDEELANINNKLYIYLEKYKSLENFDFQNFLCQFEIHNELEIINNKSINYSHNYLKSEVMPIVEDGKRESIFKINNDKSKILIHKSNSEKILIGRTNFNNGGNTQEFLLYYVKIQHNLFLTLENAPNNETKEITEVIKVLKTIYLSKISHEIKNPICLLLEIITNVKKDLHELEIFNYQFQETQKGTILDESSSEDTDEKIKFMKTNFKTMSNTSNLKNNISNLNCISEMLFQVVNDFGFYSNSIDENIQKQNTSNNNENNSPNEKKRISSPLIRKLSEKFHSKFFNNKDCKYKEIIYKVIELFKTKINIENKLAKLEFQTNMIGNLPEYLEIDVQNFQSLIFNIIYHVYKYVASGKLEVKIYKESLSSTNVLPSQMTNKIIFEITVRGVLTETNITYYSDHVSFKKESNSDERNSIKSNSRKFSNTSTVNNLNIMQICKIKNNTERNAIVDDFNNKFNLNLALMYAKKMGINLVFENVNKQHMNINFCINYTNKKEPRFKSNKNISSLESRRKSHNISKHFENDFKESTIIQLRHDSLDSNTFENYIRIIPNDITEFKKGVSVKESNIKLNFNTKLKDEEESRIIEESSSEKVTEKQHDDIFLPSDSNRTERYIQTLEFKYKDFVKKEKFVENLYLSEENEKQESTLFKSGLDNTNEVKVNQTKKDKPNSSPNVKVTSETIFNKRNSFMNTSNLKITDNLISKKRLSHVIINNTKDKLINPLINHSSEIKINKPVFRRNPTMTSSTPTYKESLDRLRDLKSPNKDEIFKVLLCDDESLIRKTLHRFFNILSSEEPALLFEVEHSDNGFECLDLLYKHYCMGKYFDLIIIDETMPFFRGSQITNLLKTMMKEGKFKEIIIISFTSYSCEEKINYIFSQGADFVLNKPIKYEEFRSFFFENILKV